MFNNFRSVPCVSRLYTVSLRSTRLNCQSNSTWGYTQILELILLFNNEANLNRTLTADQSNTMANLSPPRMSSLCVTTTYLLDHNPDEVMELRRIIRELEREK